jgi:hypothetical protein
VIEGGRDVERHKCQECIGKEAMRILEKLVVSLFIARRQIAQPGK